MILPRRSNALRRIEDFPENADISIATAGAFEAAAELIEGECLAPRPHQGFISRSALVLHHGIERSLRFAGPRGLMEPQRGPKAAQEEPRRECVTRSSAPQQQPLRGPALR
jgi:hypothetical protein